VVEKHELSVSLADLVLGDAALASEVLVGRGFGIGVGESTYLRERMREASFLFILGSKPPL
jgi:hypothetical protein